MLCKVIFLILLQCTYAIEYSVNCAQVESLWGDGSCCSASSLSASSASVETCEFNLADTSHSMAIDINPIANRPMDCTKSHLSEAGLDTFELNSSHFTHGTKRLILPGVYKLTENITFNPNPDNDHWPNCSIGFYNTTQKDYCAGQGHMLSAYRLGFFSAITMEGDNVHLDLNGHSIVQSKSFSLQQRFYSHIELADQPFIPKQGPAGGEQFGGNISSCTNCSIQNGHLGLSSHHGIHGNRARNILIQDLTLENYEVAGISLNGIQKLTIERVDLLGSRTDVPARATYSAARFMQFAWTQIKAYAAAHSPAFLATAEFTYIEDKSSALQALMDNWFDHIINNVNSTIAASNQFSNPTEGDNPSVVDGNAYGITIHGDGVIVDSFGETHSQNLHGAEDITVENVTIRNVFARVQEVLSLRGVDGKPMVDVAGGTVRMTDIWDGVANIEVDPLHEMRFALAYWSDAAQGNSTFMVTAKSNHMLGTLRIGQTYSNLPAISKAWHDANSTTFPYNITASTDLFCNFDSMHHKQKGVVGLFIQQTKRIFVKNVHIQNVNNFGPKGSDKCGHYIATPHDHPAIPDDHLGYTGTQSYGTVVTTSDHVSAVDLTIKHIFSEYGDALGVFMCNDIDTIEFDNLDISNITVGDSPTAPNAALKPCYFMAGDNVTKLYMHGTTLGL